MATITATAARGSIPAKYCHQGVISRSVEWTATTALSAGDVIQMCHIPAGARVLTVRFAGGSGTGMCEVGDGNNVDRYADSVSWSAAFLPVFSTILTGMGYTYTADDTIDVNVPTVTTGTAVGTVYLDVTYTMDP